jgi:hypothetical protein
MSRPHHDVYTGLLAVSLLGMLLSCALLFLDYQSHGDSTPSTPALVGKR